MCAADAIQYGKISKTVNESFFACHDTVDRKFNYLIICKKYVWVFVKTFLDHKIIAQNLKIGLNSDQTSYRQIC